MKKISRTAQTWASVFLLLAGAAGAAEAPPAFTQAPTAVRAGNKTVISFAVSRFTDVAVSIEDAKGRTIRHLAAGVLGSNPPRPFKPGSLAQTIEWDGQADWGRPIAEPPATGFRVRVALGMSAVYDKVVARDPESLNKVFGLAVGPDGTLYAASLIATHTVHNEGMQLVALNRDGTYRRTLIPVPADVTRAQLSDLGGDAVEVDGRLAPVVLDLHAHQTVDFWPDRGANMAVTADGLLLVPQGNLVGALPLTGAAPSGRYSAKGISVNGKGADFTTVVVSGDGRWAYVCGNRGKMTGSGAERSKAGTQFPAVFRVKLPERSEAAPFFGDPVKAGNDLEHLASPCGMALDGKGNLLIADRDNDRVVVVAEKDGRMVGSFAVEKPEGLAADHARGTIYVLRTSGKKSTELAKFSGWKNPAVLARITLDISLRDGASLALDAAANPPIVWIGCYLNLLRIEDRGDSFSSPVPVGKGRSGVYGIQSFEDLTVDRYRDDPEIYTRRGHGNGWTRFNETSEKMDTFTPDGKYIFGPAGTCIVPGPGGNIYALCQTIPAMFKFDRTGKALPWDNPHPPERDFARPGVPGAEERYIQRYATGKLSPFAVFTRVCMGYMTHTMGVRPDGHVFVFERSPKQDHRTVKALYEFEPSGRKRDKPIIWMVSDNVVGPKFDQEGNIYIAEQVRPSDAFVPREYAAYVGAVKIGADPSPDAPRQVALDMYGSILKFTPQGGLVDFLEPKWGKPVDSEPELNSGLKTQDAAWGMGGTLRPARVSGAAWIHPGISHVNFGGCNCEHVNFDVDPFGRVWYPDIGRYRIDILDSAGNELTHFGSYGNADSCGPESKDSKLAKPDIALAWPLGVVATDRYAYMGDALNRRLLRARLVHAAEAVCNVE